MAVYPDQLTPEEKSLKKRYAKLEDRRKQLRKASEKTTQQAAAPKTNLKNILKPKDAKEAAKKMLSAGKLTISKKSPVKRSGFKRVGQLPGQAPPSKKPNTGAESGQLPKPKVKASDQKALYKHFLHQNKFIESALEKIPKKVAHEGPSSFVAEEKEKSFASQECTIFVRCYQPGIGEEALRIAFKRFGTVQAYSQDPSKNSSFITFDSPNIAGTARKEMDKGMIHGSDVSVEQASLENGYVELPPEAADNKWSRIAAGRTLPGSPLKVHRHNKIISYGEVDF